MIKENTFKDNSPVAHATNGGAISIECDFINTQVEVTRGKTSPRELTSDFSVFDVQSSTFINSMSDENHEFYKYRNSLKLDQLIIKKNVFDGNEIG